MSKAAAESRSTNTTSWREVNPSQNVVYHEEQDRIRRVVFPIRRLHSGHQIVRFKQDNCTFVCSAFVLVASVTEVNAPFP